MSTAASQEHPLEDLSAGAKTRPPWGYAAALLFGFAVAAAFVVLIASRTFVYQDPDSTAFLEATRNLLAGHGLSVSSRTSSLPAITEPMSLWPPGYSWMLAGIAKLLNVNPTWLAPWLDWLCWALTPAATLFALRRALGVRAALVVACLAMLAPGAIDGAWQPMTDGPFLLVVTLSFAFLFRCFGDQVHFGSLVASGLLAGLGYTLRNAGVAVFLAVGVTFVILAALRLRPWRESVVRFVAWGAGAAVAIVPVEFRNLRVFGVLQPYSMAQSHLGLVANVRYFWAATVNDVVAFHGLSSFLVWRFAFLLAPLLALLLLLAVARKALWRAWRDGPSEVKSVFVALLAYVACGAAVVIEARTRFEWGETIDLRYIWQYDWPILALTAIALIHTLPRRANAAVLTALVLAVAGARVTYAAQEAVAIDQAQQFDRSAPTLAQFAMIRAPYDMTLRVEPLVAADAALSQVVAALPPATILVSNEAQVLRVTTGRVVHGLNVNRDCTLEHSLRAVWAGSRDKVLVLLFPKPDLIASGCWAAAARASRPAALPNRAYLVALTGAELVGPDRLAVIH